MSQRVEIRSYQPQDAVAVLTLMDLNTPRWFASTEREALLRYLAEERELYFVMAHRGQVVGCGGINYFADQGLARISWDILHPNYQGQGLGSQLLQYRLGLLRAQSSVTRVVVRTSQLVYPYYEKNGFRVVKTVADFWAPGFDLYEMELALR
jgi:ribosomal-protein-alanine N-acetyltransferase